MPAGRAGRADGWRPRRAAAATDWSAAAACPGDRRRRRPGWPASTGSAPPGSRDRGLGPALRPGRARCGRGRSRYRRGWRTRRRRGWRAAAPPAPGCTGASLGLSLFGPGGLRPGARRVSGGLGERPRHPGPASRPAALHWPAGHPGPALGATGQARRALASSAAAASRSRDSRWVIAAVSASHGSAVRARGPAAASARRTGPRSPPSSRVTPRAVHQVRDQVGGAGPLGVAQRVHRLPDREPPAGRAGPPVRGRVSGWSRAMSADR